MRYVYWLVIAFSGGLLYRGLPVEQAVGTVAYGVAALGAWGPLLFGGAYVAAALLMVPASLLTLAAGAVFGLGLGVVVVSLASITAATAAFLMARYLARDAVTTRARGHRVFAAIDGAVSDGGWKVVAMLRLSPAIPFGLQNYLLGVSGVRLGVYVAASWIAMVPGTLLYVGLGAAGGRAAAGRGGPGQWALLGLGLAATLGLTVYLTVLAKRKLAEQAGAAWASAPPGPPASRRGWGLPAAAAVLAGLAGGVTAFNDRIAGLLGPPGVTMREAYTENPPEPVFDHGALDALLAAHVRADGGVDYAALGRERAALDGYLAALADAPFDALGRDEKLALLINAYNAFTLRLMLDFPGVDSIKSIPAARRWDDARWTLAGQTYSLTQIEHALVRPNFIEPRAHWALVCAAVGCPPLRDRAYTGAGLEAQLADQARRVFTRGTRWYDVEGGGARLKLCAIMDWYRSDFVQVSGGLAEVAAQHDAAVAGRLERGEPVGVGFLAYDWALNSVSNVAGGAR